MADSALIPEVVSLERAVFSLNCLVVVSVASSTVVVDCSSRLSVSECIGMIDVAVWEFNLVGSRANLCFYN